MNSDSLLSEYALKILDSLTECIYVIDKEFKIVYLNNSACQALKLKDKSIYGSVCMSLCRSERCHLGCPITEVIRTGNNVKDLKTTFIDNEGNILPVKLNATLLKNEQDEPIGGIVSFRKDNKKSFDVYLEEQGHFYGIIGKSKKIRNVFNTIEEIAPSDACVLITGETGVGKELVADAIYKTSLRRNKPFVKINCASLPPNLLASELFGHIRGAFTGALKDRKGRFEYADGGTIFLDEIGEMPLDMQAQMLRIIQDGTFERLGESVTRKVDVRIIAATNKDLQDQINNNQFRSDLYYRLNVIPVHVPPLRERKDDIIFLIDYFLNKFKRQYDKNLKDIAADTLDILLNYDWPGNVRELENAIEYAIIRSKRGDYLCKCSLPPAIRIDEDCSGNQSISEIENDDKLQTVLALLRQNNWNKTKVANLLGINRSTIYRRLRSLDQPK